MKQLFLIFLATSMNSCSSNHIEKLISADDKFIWNIQLAGYNHNQADQKGEVTYQEFIKELRYFHGFNK